MMLSEKQIDSFRILWRSEFQEEISKSEAEKQAFVLLELIRVLRNTSHLE